MISKEDIDALMATKETIIMPSEAYDEMIKIIDSTAKPNPALVALMQRKPIWVK